MLTKLQKFFFFLKYNHYSTKALQPFSSLVLANCHGALGIIIRTYLEEIREHHVNSQKLNYVYIIFNFVNCPYFERVLYLFYKSFDINSNVDLILSSIYHITWYKYQRFPVWNLDNENNVYVDDKRATQTYHRKSPIPYIFGSSWNTIQIRGHGLQCWF